MERFLNFPYLEASAASFNVSGTTRLWVSGRNNTNTPDTKACSPMTTNGTDGWVAVP